MSTVEQRTLREHESLEGVQAEGHVLKGVKVLGLTSKNGRRYVREAVASALPLYEGARVNFDHVQPGQARSATSRFGRLVRVRVDTAGEAWADLEYNPHHPYAEAVKWWAEHDGASLGLSHDAVGEGATANGIFECRKIIKVRSVDLVADPASTKGLREGIMEPDMLPPESDEGYEAKLGHLVHAIMTDDTLDAATKRKKILAALKLMDDDAAPAPADDAEPKDAEEAVRVLVSRKDAASKKAGQLLERYVAKERMAGRMANAKSLCEKHKLPSILVTDVFLEQLAEAADEGRARALIEDRRALAGVKHPRSAPEGAGGARMDLKEFSQQLRR